MFPEKCNDSKENHIYMRVLWYITVFMDFTEMNLHEIRR